MTILAIASLLISIFLVIVAVVTGNLFLLIPAGLCYLSCGIAIYRISRKT